MAEDYDARITRLLDQLERPDLSTAEQQRLMRQVEFLESRRDWQA